MEPPSPHEQNHAHNEAEIGGGLLGGGNITSTEQVVSPLTISEIYAQKSESGDSRDSGGLITTLRDRADGINSNALSDSYVAF
ncbi:hypothetical protein BH18THE2_BH18THE2_41250 [soil metagenome]